VRALAPCSCQSLPLAKAGGQALGPRLRGDDEQGGVTHANFCNEVLGQRHPGQPHPEPASEQAQFNGYDRDDQQMQRKGQRVPTPWGNEALSAGCRK
jgi:hypothetical protein